MIKEKLKERTFLVKASPLPDRIKDAYNHRRDFASIEMEHDEDLSDKYDTFFDYEDDLANLKASGEQYAQMLDEDSGSIGILEEKEEAVISYSPIVMIEKEAGKAKYTEVNGFEFIQCSFVKSNGEQCKRQSPKESDICSVHRKYKDKHSL